MNADERVALLQRAIEHFNEGDLDAAAALLHPVVEWPDLMHDKLIWGREAVREYWDRQLVVAVPTLTFLDAIPAGDDIVLVSEQRALDRRTGQDLIVPTRVVQRYGFRDGLISRMRPYPSVEDALAAT